MDNLTTSTPAPTVGAGTVQAIQETPTVGADTVTTNQVANQPVQADKATRFKERAENQASRVMAELEKLQKLSNRKYYTYTPEQINELFGAIQTTLDETKSQFGSDAPEKKKLFTFSV